LFSEDFVLRQINLAIAVLARVLRLKQAGQRQEAGEAIDQAVEALLGLRAGLVKQLDDQRLLALCFTQNEVDIGRIAVLADLFNEEGEILALEQRPEESAQAYTRALRFSVEAALSDMPHLSREQAEKIETIARLAPVENLSVEGRLAYLDYCDGLLGKDPRLLAAAGVDRNEVENRKAWLEEHLRSYLDPPPGKEDIPR